MTNKELKSRIEKIYAREKRIADCLKGNGTVAEYEYEMGARATNIPAMVAIIRELEVKLEEQEEMSDALDYTIKAQAKRIAELEAALHKLADINNWTYENWLMKWIGEPDVITICREALNIKIDIARELKHEIEAVEETMKYTIEERFGDTWFNSAYRDNLSAAQEYMAEIRNKAVGLGQSAALRITHNGKIVDEMECKKRGHDDSR